MRAVRLLHALGACPTVLREPPALYFHEEGGGDRRDAAADASAAAAARLRLLCSDADAGGGLEGVLAAGRGSDRFTLSLQSMESADALLYHPRQELLRRTLGADYTTPSGAAADDDDENDAAAAEYDARAAGTVGGGANISSSSSSSSGGGGGGGPIAPAANKRMAKLSQIRQVSSDYERRVVLYSSLLLPWAKLRYPKATAGRGGWTKKKKKKKRGAPGAMASEEDEERERLGLPPLRLGLDRALPASRYLLSESLKLRTRDADDVEKIAQLAGSCAAAAA